MAATLSAPSLPERISQTPASALQLNGSAITANNTTAPVKQGTSSTKQDLLVVSPYTEEAHLLDLSTLDTANQLLARALVDLKFIRDDHRTAPYVVSFNWPEIVESVRKLAEISGFEWKKTDL